MPRTAVASLRRRRHRKKGIGTICRQIGIDGKSIHIWREECRYCRGYTSAVSLITADYYNARIGFVRRAREPFFLKSPGPGMNSHRHRHRRPSACTNIRISASAFSRNSIKRGYVSIDANFLLSEARERRHSLPLSPRTRFRRRLCFPLSRFFALTEIYKII